MHLRSSSRQPAPTGPKMTLRQLFASLGKGSEMRCSHQTGVPLTVIDHAIAHTPEDEGENVDPASITPLAHSYMRKVAAWLSHEYERDIQVSDLGVVTVQPGREPMQAEE